MKRIVIPAVFKAVCCLLILILLAIGFQYLARSLFGKGLIMEIDHHGPIVRPNEIIEDLKFR
jgi:hypothetical protein